MSTQSNSVSSSGDTPRSLKILMLHGYTQSGPLFHAKTAALEKALHKAFPPQTLHITTTTSKLKPPPSGTLTAYPGGITLIYLSAPRKLTAANIPGYTLASAGPDTPAVHDWRAWWQRNDATGEYDGIDEGLQAIADTIRDVGGVDGAIGFSQGGAAAAMLASLLERERPAAFAQAQSSRGGMPYPGGFLSSPLALQPGPEEPSALGEKGSIIQPPLKFAVSYSGFRAVNPLYASFYEPKISTPMLHVVGTLDSVVEESRNLELAQACVEQKVVYHPGGHFVPIGKDMIGALVGFITECCNQKVQENAEKMEPLFKM